MCSGIKRVKISCCKRSTLWCDSLRFPFGGIWSLPIINSIIFKIYILSAFLINFKRSISKFIFHLVLSVGWGWKQKRVRERDHLKRTSVRFSSLSGSPVLHNWCNKGRGMCYSVCGMVHIKEPLLLIGKSSLCGGSRFPFSLSEWSLTICLTPYNCK